MSIDQRIEDAVAANDLAALEALERELFAPAETAVAPFAPALALRTGAKAEPEGPLRAAQAAPDGAPGGPGPGLSLLNRIARAKRQVAFNLRILGGFDGITIVSEGDSWFQYPVLLRDVIDHLSDQADKAVLSFGEAGDLLDRIAARQEYLPALEARRPDAFLLSGGGNDLLGDGRLAGVLRPWSGADDMAALFDEPAYQALMARVRAGYEAILDGLEAARPGMPVFGHAYDVPPIDPDGPWIGRPLASLGIPHALGGKIVGRILGDFAAFLARMAQERPDFEFVDLRGTVGGSRNSWHDEIHPKDAGFGRIAAAFSAAVAARLARDAEGAGAGAEARPASAATYSSRDADPEAGAGADAATIAATVAAPGAPATSAPADRDRMARRILDYEARRDPATGRLMVYRLPPGDGGGRYEVAGINERYHKAEADHLVALIEAGRHDEAEAYAIAFIAGYTDAADRWCATLPVEFYLRDCVFNRGPGGAAWIVQHAVGVATDRVVGPITRGAVARAEADPAALLRRLRASREVYERRFRDESSRFWRGLVNRWNKALDFALTFPAGPAPAAPAAPPPRGAGSAGDGARILNCNPSKGAEDDWGVAEAEGADLVRAAPLPEEVDLRADWWAVGDQGMTGSCVGWAAADSVLRWQFERAGRIAPQQRLSVRFIWMAAKETDVFTHRPTGFIEDAGTSLKAALDVARKLGCVTEEVLPFDRREVYRGAERVFYAQAAALKIASYHNLGRSTAEWRRWLYQNGPILTRLDVDDAFQDAAATGGRLDRYDPAGARGGHAVALVGYTRDGFIIRNSWGAGWGDGGYAVASEDYARAAFTEAYAVIV
ncbi:C1 family peptidase [Rhodovulum sp. DZ06]|uniref:C1 family peptidase n=1 Tax=Rhodovulum sp. DZ06 TaxID=3425126 RepID=UPI003D33D47F